MCVLARLGLVVRKELQQVIKKLLESADTVDHHFARSIFLFSTDGVRGRCAEVDCLAQHVPWNGTTKYLAYFSVD